jgi:N-acetylmuramic acid 6-phosphate etherase
VARALTSDGRLIYVGAGSSGRMGVLDAAECYPTYGVDQSQVVALIAGGPAAVTRAVEAAEDSEQRGAEDIDTLDVAAPDVIVGIAASGHTPYVVGALRRARERGAYTVALVGNGAGSVAAAAELVIAPETGPEVIAGSTRMKAGTAQKLVLNMLSTTAMILTGRTYGNLMVNMRAVNAKLRERMRRIVAEAGHASPEAAEAALAASDYDMKTAIVMLLSGVDAGEARLRLERAAGVVRHAL